MSSKTLVGLFSKKDSSKIMFAQDDKVYQVNWETDHPTKSTKIGSNLLTSFAITEDDMLAAYGTENGTIVILEGNNLNEI